MKLQMFVPSVDRKRNQLIKISFPKSLTIKYPDALKQAVYCELILQGIDVEDPHWENECWWCKKEITEDNCKNKQCFYGGRNNVGLSKTTQSN